MRFVISFLALALVAVLGAIQFVSGVALRSAAQSGAWPTLVPASLVARVDTLAPSVPIPSALRFVFARAALASGDVARAAAERARLQPSLDRDVLDAQIARARGDVAGAVAGFLAAGELAGLHDVVEELAGRGDFAQALRLQRAIVARLHDDRTQRDAGATAAFELGLLEERAAYALAVGSPERHAHEMRAADAYALAVALSPLSQQYLIALGNQQLNVAELDAADATFDRARDLDPTGADPLLGLGEVAARRGDRAAARRYLARARSLVPDPAAADRLAHEIGG